jgi:hypothetical protein
MSTTNTGGPAFPYPFYDEKGHCIDGIDGMTLRDYFAAKALQGLLADPEPFDLWDGDKTIADTYAREAYVYADAMLRAREA